MQSVNFSIDQDDDSYIANINHAEENSLEFLNQFGAARLVAALQRAGLKLAEDYAFQDLTGDGVRELAFGVHEFYVFGCDQGEYVTLLTLPMTGLGLPPGIADIGDINRDRVPEMILLTGMVTQGGRSYQIYAWDGSRFRSLLLSVDPERSDDGAISVDAGGNISSRDLDGDGVREIVAFSGMGAESFYVLGLPWRYEWQYFRWDGTNYILYDRDFSAPEYRFQAVRDGDRLTLAGRYDEALASYQQAIFSDKLGWWTADRRQYEQEAYGYEHWGKPAPTTTPMPDPDELPNLVAYSRYRIMLLHLLRGWEAEAKTVYETLQAKFPEGTVGDAYAEMAAVFWQEYQSSKSLGNACRRAEEYASDHEQDILHYIGSDFLGVQSPPYVPEDVCPFK